MPWLDLKAGAFYFAASLPMLASRGDLRLSLVQACTVKKWLSGPAKQSNYHKLIKYLYIF
jgi:hypothetical protein